MRPVINMPVIDAEVESYLDGLPLNRAWVVSLDQGTETGPVDDLAVCCGLQDGDIDEADIARINAALAQAEAPFEQLITTVGTPRRTLLLRAAPIGSGQPRAIVSVQDKTAEHQLEGALRRSQQSLLAAKLGRTLSHGEALHLALTDALTGLPNRRAFNIALAGACEEGGALLCLLDMDGFKRINDQLGHAIGDRLLAAVADRLRTHLPPTAFVSRLAGDEFAAIIPGIETEAEAEPVADKIAEAFRTRLTLGDVEIAISLTVGSALAPAGVAAEELFRRADIALHTGKLNAKGTARLHAEGAGLLDEHETLSDIRAILQDRKAPLSVTNVADVGTGTLTALAVQLAPGGESDATGAELFETAQRYGIASDLLQVVAESVARLMVQRGPDVRIHLALPPSAFAHRAAERDIIEPLENARLSPGRLAIETCQIAPDTKAAETLRGLARAGVGRVLAPWDLGLAAFADIATMPVEAVKVPATTLAPVLANEAGRVWISAALSALPDGVSAVATGVNKGELKAAVIAAGFHQVEGTAAAVETGARYAAAS